MSERLQQRREEVREKTQLGIDQYVEICFGLSNDRKFCPHRISPAPTPWCFRRRNLGIEATTMNEVAELFQVCVVHVVGADGTDGTRSSSLRPIILEDES